MGQIAHVCFWTCFSNSNARWLAARDTTRFTVLEILSASTTPPLSHKRRHHWCGLAPAKSLTLYGTRFHHCKSGVW